MIESEIEKRACEWILELETAERVDAVWLGLQLWLAEDPRHVVVFRRMEKAWRMSREVLELNYASENCGPPVRTMIRRLSRN